MAPILKPVAEDVTAGAGALVWICIAIPTYARAVSLSRLLEALDEIDVPEGCAIEVLVLDNAPYPAVAQLVADHDSTSPFDVRYLHVATPGLAAVRNEALAYGTTGSHFIAMIDDDEIPTTRWLCELVRVQRATAADAVFGPVPSRFPTNAPNWLKQGSFLEPPRYRDCEVSPEGYSGNCLLNIATVRRIGLTFDTAFNFAGGEDLIFFRDLRANGGRLVFAANAIAHEDVQTDRCNAAYVLKLYFRRGNTLALNDLRKASSTNSLATRFLKANARCWGGLATFAPRLLLGGRKGGMQALSDVALGLGALAGLFGYTYQAYRRPASSLEPQDSPFTG